MPLYCSTKLSALLALYCSKKISALLRGITSKQHGDFYCLICLCSFATENKRESRRKVCEKHRSGHSGFTDVDHLWKARKECKNLTKTWDSRYIYQNELDKPCFQTAMVYGDFKDLSRRTTRTTKYYVKKHLILLTTQNMTDNNVDFHQWFMKFFHKSLVLLLAQGLKLILKKNN